MRIFYSRYDWVLRMCAHVVDVVYGFVSRHILKGSGPTVLHKFCICEGQGFVRAMAYNLPAPVALRRNLTNVKQKLLLLHVRSFQWRSCDAEVAPEKIFLRVTMTHCAPNGNQIIFFYTSTLSQRCLSQPGDSVTNLCCEMAAGACYKPNVSDSEPYVRTWVYLAFPLLGCHVFPVFAG